MYFAHSSLRLQQVKRAGAKVATTVREVVEASDITFAMLSDPVAAREVATMKDGNFSHQILSGGGFPTLLRDVCGVSVKLGVLSRQVL